MGTGETAGTVSESVLQQQRQNAETGTEDYSDTGKMPGNVVQEPLVTPSSLTNARRDSYFSDKPYTEKYNFYNNVGTENKNMEQTKADEERYKKLAEKLRNGEQLSGEDRTFYFLYRDKMLNTKPIW